MHGGARNRRDWVAPDAALSSSPSSAAVRPLPAKSSQRPTKQRSQPLLLLLLLMMLLMSMVTRVEWHYCCCCCCCLSVGWRQTTAETRTRRWRCWWRAIGADSEQSATCGRTASPGRTTARPLRHLRPHHPRPHRRHHGRRRRHQSIDHPSRRRRCCYCCCCCCSECDRCVGRPVCGGGGDHRDVAGSSSWCGSRARQERVAALLEDAEEEEEEEEDASSLSSSPHRTCAPSRPSQRRRPMTLHRCAQVDFHSTAARTSSRGPPRLLPHLFAVSSCLTANSDALDGSHYCCCCCCCCCSQWWWWCSLWWKRRALVAARKRRQ